MVKWTEVKMKAKSKAKLILILLSARHMPMKS